MSSRRRRSDPPSKLVSLIATATAAISIAIAIAIATTLLFFVVQLLAP
jgi:hypothetical protein